MAIGSAQLAPNAIASTNVQSGSITDSKIAAITALMKGAENNMRVVRGILRGDTGSIFVGSNFTAVFNAPGTGGSNVASFAVGTTGSDYTFTATGNYTSQITQQPWIMAGGQFFQVQSVAYQNPSTIIEVYGTGCGGLPGTVTVVAGMRLASEWNITFTPPFSGFPAIATAGGGGDAFNQNISQVNVHLKRSLSDNGTNFTAIVGYDLIPGSGYPGGCPPFGNGFEFIAVGPQ